MAVNKGQTPRECVGVLGGMGSQATAYFFQLLLDMADAHTDQENVNVFIYNYAEIPDRSSFILETSDESPLPYCWTA